MDHSLSGSSDHGKFPGRNTGVCCHFLLQGVLLTQGSEHASCIHCSGNLFSGSICFALFVFLLYISHMRESCIIYRINLSHLPLRYIHAVANGKIPLLLLLLLWLNSRISVQLSLSVVSDTLWSHGLQHSNSWSLLKLMSTELVMPSNHPVLRRPFSSCLQSFPAPGSFPRSHLFA